MSILLCLGLACVILSGCVRQGFEEGSATQLTVETDSVGRRELGGPSGMPARSFPVIETVLETVEVEVSSAALVVEIMSNVELSTCDSVCDQRGEPQTRDALLGAQAQLVRAVHVTDLSAAQREEAGRACQTLQHQVDRFDQISEKSDASHAPQMGELPGVVVQWQTRVRQACDFRKDP